jgi:endonuclease G
VSRQRRVAASLLGAIVAAAAWLLAGCAATPGPGPVSTTDSPSSSVGSINLALGLPTDADPSDDLILDHEVFVVSYNVRRAAPNWAAWRLVADDLGTAHRMNNFHVDALLPADWYHVGPLDYRGSGYDRGHLCPSGDRTSSASANATTFVMTNMLPQVRALNVGPWERLETYERELAGRQGKQVFIVAGGLFGGTDSQVVIGPGIAVPRATFKVLVVLERGQGAADVSIATTVYAVIMPNAASVSGTTWQQYLVSVDEVERESGYNFLSRVAEGIQQVIEARLPAPP